MGINKVVGTILSITGALLSVDHSVGITIMFGGLTLIVLTDFIDSVSIEYEITKYPHEFSWNEELSNPEHDNTIPMVSEKENEDENDREDGAKLNILRRE